MTRFLTCALALVLSVATLRAQETEAKAAPADPRANVLRVATWNLLNLFDEVDDPDRPDEDTDPKSFADMVAMARFLDEIEADVVGVQEVENRRILERLNSYLERPFAYVELIEGNDFRGIDVGILSRVPIERAASHRQMPLEGDQRYSRDFPFFRLRPTDRDALQVGVVHLKSKRGDKKTSDAWRHAEAMGVATVVKRQLELEPKTPCLVMGDFNDRRDSEPLAPIFGVLEDLTAKLVPESDRFSFVHRGEPEQIDFILTANLRATRARILHRPDNPSDHHPVIVDFDLGAPIRRVAVPSNGAPRPPQRPVIDARNLEEIGRNFLKEVTIEGSVAKVFRPKSGGVLLNFDADFRKAITVYVPRESIETLGDLDALVGQRVRVSGPVGKHRDALQIRLSRPEQLERPKR
ncbi:MAG: endonuclease/exonuclease/phosphatase family protein [Planctomycetota bacterium]